MAQRQASAAAGSRSEARAEAGGSQLQAWRWARALAPGYAVVTPLADLPPALSDDVTALREPTSVPDADHFPDR